MLQCFHSFCQGCLEKVQDHPDRVSCPHCHLDTPLGSGGVAGLLSDYGMTGLLDNITGPQTGIDFGATFCTGCKSREGAPAVARCLTCATFLCPNCVMAHKVLNNFILLKAYVFQFVKKFRQIEKNSALYSLNVNKVSRFFQDFFVVQFLKFHFFFSVHALF